MRIKICGITNLADAEATAERGAWAIGLNHFRGSPRFCPPEAAVEIAAAMRRRCEVAGVFVNAPLEEVTRAVDDEGLTLVQLHGDEGPAFCQEVTRRTGAGVIKAFRVRSQDEVRGAGAFRVAYHLMDAHHPERHGGTGERFDWSLVAGRRSEIPMLLAGGLTPENVAEAIAVAKPWGVDVASGVESAPGRKDPALLAAFFEAVNVSTAEPEPAR